eukprot:s6185_g1.t1
MTTKPLRQSRAIEKVRIGIPSSRLPKHAPRHPRPTFAVSSALARAFQRWTGHLGAGLWEGQRDKGTPFKEFGTGMEEFV